MAHPDIGGVKEEDKEPRWEPELDIVSRREWGALPPTGRLKPRKLFWPYVLWTFSNSEPCYSKEDCVKAMQALQKRHMDKGLPDIQYNFYFGGDLNIYEGRGWQNFPTILYPGYTDMEKMNCSFAYIGKYEGQNYPNQGVLDLRKRLVTYGIEKELIDQEFCNLLLTTNLNQC